MSRDELVNAYLQGRVSRRMFIRGLVAAGVSVTAAVTYSQVLSASTGPPRRARALQYGDQYGNHYGNQYGEPGGSGAGAGAAAAGAVTASPRFTG